MATNAALKIQIATRVDEETVRRLDALCEQLKRPRSFVLEEALERRLAEADREPQREAA